MPVKEKTVNDFYIKTDSGMVRIENAIVEIEQRLMTENEVRECFNVPHEVTLYILDKEKLLVIFGVCTDKQLQTNNWRKNHGMIMKRRKTKQNLQG